MPNITSYSLTFSSSTEDKSLAVTATQIINVESESGVDLGADVNWSLTSSSGAVIATGKDFSYARINQEYVNKLLHVVLVQYDPLLNRLGEPI